MIPAPFIQDLIARTDIIDVVGSYIKLKKGGANYVACCPFHNEKTASFTVSPTKQFYHCFGCGEHGTVIDFVMQYEGLGFIDTVRDLAARHGLDVPFEEKSAAGTRSGAFFEPARPVGQVRPLIEIMTRTSEFYREELRKSQRAIDYCKERGLSGEIAAFYGIGYAPDDWQGLKRIFPDYDTEQIKTAGLVIDSDGGGRFDRFRDRLMIPIMNMKGDIIAFGGRVIGKGEPKYMNSPETPVFEKGRELFGIPQARLALRSTGVAIVTEGYMDVIALAQFGIRNAVATLGTATTPTHIERLFRHVDRVVFCFDGDAAGRKAAWRALENVLGAMTGNKLVGFIFLPDAHDPDSYVRKHGKAAFERLVAESMPLSDFMLKELASRVNLGTAEGRSGLLAEAKPLLHKLELPALRTQIVKQLAELTGFTQAEVENLCELRPIAPAPAAQVLNAAARKGDQDKLRITRKLLRRLLQVPQLAVEMDVSILPDEPARPALVRLRSIVEFDPSVTTYVMLREHFVSTPEAVVVEAVAADLIELPIEDADAEMEVRELLNILRHKHQAVAFEKVSAGIKKAGIADMSAEEKQAYKEHLMAMRPRVKPLEGKQ